jgi:hypothetical protein
MPGINTDDSPWGGRTSRPPWHICELCDRTLANEVHHKVAMEDGGAKYDLDNLVSTCKALPLARDQARNGRKGGREMTALSHRGRLPAAPAGSRSLSSNAEPANSHSPGTNADLQGRRAWASAARTSAGAGFPDAPATPCLNLATHACPLGFRPPLSLERRDAQKVAKWSSGTATANTAPPREDVRI